MAATLVFVKWNGNGGMVAAGCSASPAAMVPLAVDTALANKVRGRKGGGGAGGPTARGDVSRGSREAGGGLRGPHHERKDGAGS